jgi:NAD(P)-dependent dehydrogenase (short-subunit alcohol dehydrogenase family)
MNDKGLKGHVAVVAGATRGAGRGIARALGEAGAIVYMPAACGASPRHETARDDRRNRGDDQRGRGMRSQSGRSHVGEEVEALFGRVDREQGRLDILVNSIAGEEPMMKQYTSFWKANLEHGEAIFRQSLLSHIITARHAAPLMIRARTGLIVEVTESDILSAGGNPLSQSVKLALKGLALNMAAELDSHGVAAIAITPGFLRSEAMLDHFGVTEANWRDAGKKDRNFRVGVAAVCRPRGRGAGAGRARARADGTALQLSELAREYQFVDADGRP